MIKTAVYRAVSTRRYIVDRYRVGVFKLVIRKAYHVPRQLERPCANAAVVVYPDAETLLLALVFLAAGSHIADGNVG